MANNTEDADDVSLTTGDQIRVCHKTARVRSVNKQNDSVVVSLTVGGVAGNTLTVTTEYATEHKITS